MLLDAQCGIHRIGCMRALAADIIRALVADRTYYSDNGLEAQILVVGSLTTTAGDRPLFGRTLTEKAGQNACTDTMHTIPNQGLNRFHVNLTGPTAVGEDLSCEAAYFAEGFLLDRFESFFSCAGSSSGSVGRNRQIWALTSTNSL